MATPNKNADDMQQIERFHTVEAVPDFIKTDGGVLLDITGANTHHLKLAEDGHPSEDPGDPLCWSSWKKHALLYTLAYGAFCSDFISGLCPPLIIAQGTHWQMNPNDVNHANTLNILLLGVGALFWVPLSTWWGRAPVVFWTAFIALFLNLGVALSPTFNSFYVTRALSGLISNAPPTIAIAFLRDIFFFHERARKIGIWTCLFIVSPYCGPFIANFMLAGTNSWKAPLWLGFAMHCLYFVALLLFLDETWFNRDVHQHEQPNRPTTLTARMSRIMGIWQIKHHKHYFLTLRHSLVKFVKALLKPVLILIFFNYLICFAWAIGINVSTAILFATPVEFGGYGYNYKQLGYLYFTPVVAVFLGEIFGHFSNDWHAKRYIRRHKGVFEPEVRLINAELAAILMIAGLVMVGFTLHLHLNVAVLVIGWGMHVIGIMILSVATFAYAVDAYPTAPAETAGWISFLRVIGGFSVGYFQQPWGALVGFQTSFGTQAATVAFGLCFVVLVHVYGHRLRVKSGELN
ncbi:hypothetical protein LTR10_023375 [Elasticomyces elasticus]|nr:hypothetical protein LTR10_023375 [Elasticomyces elasticus]